MTFRGSANQTSNVETMYESYGSLLRVWLTLEAMVLAYSVLMLLRGNKLGPYLMILITMIGLVFEANPFADYDFEVDRSEAIKWGQSELAMLGCLCIFTASSAFKFARIIKLSNEI